MFCATRRASRVSVSESLLSFACGSLSPDPNSMPIFTCCCFCSLADVSSRPPLVVMTPERSRRTTWIGTRY